MIPAMQIANFLQRKKKKLSWSYNWFKQRKKIVFLGPTLPVTESHVFKKGFERPQVQEFFKVYDF